MPGQDWDLEIRKAVRESDVVVVCLSNNSTTKAGYVQKEIRFALDVADEQPEGAIYLIPVRIEECKVPIRLSKWQWVNLFEASGIDKLNLSLIKRANVLGIKKTNIEPLMIKIPEGKFLMGTTLDQIDKLIENGARKEWFEDEYPQHTVELSEYSISKYLITNRDYQIFVQNIKYSYPYHWDNGKFPVREAEHPVTYVTLNDAIVYCNWLSEKSGKSYRLPTEAEWEKAARGDNGHIYPWGDKFAKKANTEESKIHDTSRVGNFSPQGDSPYGCVAMVSNVGEWCADWFYENEYRNRMGNVKNPKGPRTGINRVLRGGSFLTSH